MVIILVDVHDYSWRIRAYPAVVIIVIPVIPVMVPVPVMGIIMMVPV